MFTLRTPFPSSARRLAKAILKNRTFIDRLVSDCVVQGGMFAAIADATFPTAFPAAWREAFDQDADSVFAVRPLVVLASLPEPQYDREHLNDALRHATTFVFACERSAGDVLPPEHIAAGRAPVLVHGPSGSDLPPLPRDVWHSIFGWLSLWQLTSLRCTDRATRA